MTLNIDCVRALLLYMEKADYLEVLRMPQVYADLPNYSQNDINYSVLKLSEAGYIDAIISPYDDGILIAALKDITFQGHEFLANIREDKIWIGVKTIAGKIGATSLDAIVQIASKVITELIKSQFGLPTSIF